MKKACLIIIFIVFLVMTTSCMSIQGGSDREDEADTPPTLGQELIDLKRARDLGAISANEYSELKKILKKSYE